ncbi:hypothetical protein GDO81_004076 [Engystomops pustulosus]|uniref:Uncharacterized protein n=1 Tax=Engystomops pustulosus TaxID=76066 RepID=A0AAV6ZVV8_ENGPU|nr:hypothetical protein GDO81_004076 [Engystomops pustulosus]
MILTHSQSRKRPRKNNIHVGWSMVSKLLMSVPHWQQSPRVTNYSLLLIWQMFYFLCPCMKIASIYLPLPVQYFRTPDVDSHKGGKTHPASTPRPYRE